MTQDHTEWVFTRMDAYIVEEDGSFCVRVCLHNDANKDECAWGEEVAQTIEMATQMVNGLAGVYSIGQESITVSIVMERYKDGTFH